MKGIEEKLRAGMTRNGILDETQEQIIQSITSFALYGFPESHAASFALIAYASAYLKCHYLAAFTAALLNNQPMGFYHPSTLVKDAQRHGLKMLPMDVTKSDWKCTLEPVLSSQFSVLSKGNGGMSGENIAVRLGLKYARGLREPAGQALVRERSLERLASVQDLARRVPELRKDELTTLAEIGALNAIGGSPRSHRDTKVFHRRDALWQVERAVRWPGPVSYTHLEAARWAETFDRWGIRKLRALAALPEVPLSERLGQQGIRLQKLARGAASRSLRMLQPQLIFAESVDLEYPIVLLEPLALLLNRMLEQVCARLSARALAAQELHLNLELAAVRSNDCASIDRTLTRTFSRTCLLYTSRCV